jgi:hypothetical protein
MDRIRTDPKNSVVPVCTRGTHEIKVQHLTSRKDIPVPRPASNTREHCRPRHRSRASSRKDAIQRSWIRQNTSTSAPYQSGSGICKLNEHSGTALEDPPGLTMEINMPFTVATSKSTNPTPRIMPCNWRTLSLGRSSPQLPGLPHTSPMPYLALWASESRKAKGY